MKAKISTIASIPEEILRNLGVLYSTPAGSVVGDREFGIDESIMDAPIHLAKVKLIAEYAMKTKKYEPRVKVKNVDFDSDHEGLLQAKVVVDWS